jgi:hypothetical protein
MFFNGGTSISSSTRTLCLVCVLLVTAAVAGAIHLSAQGRGRTVARDTGKIDYGFPTTATYFEYNRELMGNWIDADGFGGGNCGSLKDERGNPRNTCQIPVDKLEPLLNGRAKAWIEFFDEPLSLRWSCAAANLTTALGEAYMWKFEFRSDQVQQHFEQSSWTREIYIDGRPHPPAEQLFYHGHSLGKMDGDVFVVDATNFTFDPEGFDDQSHIATSHLKRQVEKYKPLEDGMLEIEITVDDPIFLKAPFTWVQISQRPDRDWTGEWFCDPEVGFHHLYSTAPQRYPDDHMFQKYKAQD